MEQTHLFQLQFRSFRFFSLLLHECGLTSGLCCFVIWSPCALDIYVRSDTVTIGGDRRPKRVRPSTFETSAKIQHNQSIATTDSLSRSSLLPKATKAIQNTILQPTTTTNSHSGQNIVALESKLLTLLDTESWGLLEIRHCKELPNVKLGVSNWKSRA